jgi:hypothetical protein
MQAKADAGASREDLEPLLAQFSFHLWVNPVVSSARCRASDYIKASTRITLEPILRNRYVPVDPGAIDHLAVDHLAMAHLASDPAARLRRHCQRREHAIKTQDLL